MSFFSIIREFEDSIIRKLEALPQVFNAENLLYLAERLINLCIEGITLFVILLQELVGWKYLFLILRELALVEVAVNIKQLLGGEPLLLLALLVVDNLLAVVPPVNDRLTMLHLHRLRL